MLQALTMLFFSPTGNTLRAARLLAQGLAEKITEIDLSLPQGEAMHFGENDTVLIAGPVFGGRMPAYFLERLARFTGNHTKAITAAVYGNRAYEDALLELNDAAQRQGFQVVASAALLAEHSMVRTVAAGRPDQEDQKQISKFAQAIIKKYDSGRFSSPEGGSDALWGERYRFDCRPRFRRQDASLFFGEAGPLYRQSHQGDYSRRLWQPRL